MRTLLCLSVLAIYSTQTHSALHHCNNSVYCEGPILKYVSKYSLYNDSKSFVDLKLKNKAEETVNKFNALLKATDQNPSKEQVQEFLQQNFEEADELEKWQPPDFKADPEFLNKIENETIKNFAKNIVSIWPTLGRKVRKDVTQTPELYSLLPLPHGFVIPGGRFKEIYYWDTYWIVEGLLLSDMTQTVKGILDNFISLVRSYGFIPNGSRVYYLDRSQPPFLTLMAQVYYQKTNDIEWLRANIDALDSELMHFINDKTVTVNKGNKQYTLAHYISGSDNPRPESYSEDIETCGIYNSASDTARCYNELKSGAETGWDFSSRWLFDSTGGNTGDLAHIATTRVIPTDLNALLCKDFDIIKSMYEVLGLPNKAEFWAQKSREWRAAIEAVLYDEEDGVWYDYDTQLGRARKAFYPSNLSPLALDIVSPRLAKSRGCKVAQYLRSQGVDRYAGGVPTSLQKTSGQQWDYPNAWPPLQDGIVSALHNTRCPVAGKLGRELALKWIESMIVGYNKDKAMYEKYDVREVGKGGGGGEYEVQTGFGWTNGAVLKLINNYVIKKWDE